MNICTIITSNYHNLNYGYTSCIWSVKIIKHWSRNWDHGKRGSLTWGLKNGICERILLEISKKFGSSLDMRT